MALLVLPMTPTDVRRLLLGTTEGHFTDFKAKQILPGKLTRSLTLLTEPWVSIPGPEGRGGSRRG
jgi:hypothetical protein